MLHAVQHVDIHVPGFQFRHLEFLQFGQTPVLGFQLDKEHAAIRRNDKPVRDAPVSGGRRTCNTSRPAPEPGEPAAPQSLILALIFSSFLRCRNPDIALIDGLTIDAGLYSVYKT